MKRNIKQKEIIAIFGILTIIVVTFSITNRKESELFNSDIVKKAANYELVDPNYEPTEESAILNQESSQTIETQQEIPQIRNDFVASQSVEQLGSSAIKSLSISTVPNQITYVDLGEDKYSSIVYRWEKGNLYSGNSEETFEKIEITEDGVAPSRMLVSEIHQNKGEQLYVKTSEQTVVHIDLLQYEQEKSNDLITISPSEIQNEDSGAKYSSLPIISRDEWGAGSDTWDPNSDSDIDDPTRFVWNPGYYRASRIVVHHTASPNYTVDPSKAVRDIYLYHAYSRGWGDVGYNYLIDQFGNIYEGKAGGDEVFAYHALTEANTMSIGIALIGNFDNTTPTAPQQEALAQLMAEKSILFDFNLKQSNGSLNDWLDTDVTVFGHKDSYFWCHQNHSYSYRCPSEDQWMPNATACPGANLHPILGNEIVPLAMTYVDAGFVDIKETVIEVNQMLDTSPTFLDSFIVTYNEPTDVDASVIEAKIPSYSGIKYSVIENNTAHIVIGDWDDGLLVPTQGWTGKFPNTFFPASEGKKDRLRTLMKIFLLDEDVENVDLHHIYKLSPLE